jgi:ethanolamine ammonia-lyase large subunit
MQLSITLKGRRFHFAGVKDVLAKANEAKSGDALAGIASGSEIERVAAKEVLSGLTMQDLRDNPVVSVEDDEVSNIIDASLDDQVFKKIAGWTVAQLREFLLRADEESETDSKGLAEIGSALSGEMAAAVVKIMSNLDLVQAAKKFPVVVKARTTLGLPGRLGCRLQPNHPTDDLQGVRASIFDGLSYGAGDAVIGINPVFDSVDSVARLLEETANIIERYKIPTQNCVLSHITTQMQAIERGARAGLIFQSIAGTQKGNEAFGLDSDLLLEAMEIGEAYVETGLCVSEKRFMYFETGQGSELSSLSHYGADQVTLEARCYAFARCFKPFLVNDVVGFIGPEYLASGREMIRAGLEDHFMAKLLGLPMGVDACYTNHMDADQNDLENLTMLLVAAGVNYFMGVPMGDDVMLSYQSTSFHDIASLRSLYQLRPAPEFELWLEEMGIMSNGKLTALAGDASIFSLN